MSPIHCVKVSLCSWGCKSLYKVFCMLPPSDLKCSLFPNTASAKTHIDEETVQVFSCCQRLTSNGWQGRHRRIHTSRPGSDPLLRGRMLFIGFRECSYKCKYQTRNHTNEQCSLLQTIFNSIFLCVPPGEYLCLSPPNPLLFRFLNLSIDISLTQYISVPKVPWII